MNRLFVLLVAIVVASAAKGWAGEQPKAGGGAAKPAAGVAVFSGASTFDVPGGTTTVWGGGKSAAAWYIESIDKTVHLTDAQKKAMTAIIEARDKAQQDFQAQNAERLKAAAAAMAAAFKGKDKEAIAKAQKAYQEAYAPMQEVFKKYQKELDAVLTPEQQAKQQEQRMTAWIKNLTDPVQLSGEQIEKARAAYGELAKAADHEALGRKLPETIQNILTSEQKATIVKHRAMMYVKAVYARAKLTDEQMKKVQTLVDDLAKGQNPKMDWQAFGKLAEKIGGLLTDQQKEAMKAPYAAGGQGGLAPGAPVKGPGQTLIRTGEGTLTISDAKAHVGGITVKDGTLTITGNASSPGGKPGEKKPSGVKVTQLPGGGIQVTISEGGDVRVEANKAQPKTCDPFEQAMNAAKARMREKVKRQHELAEQAWQASQKLEALGPDKKAEAHELWEKLERIEGELRQTFEPAAAPFPPPGGAWIPPGAPLPGQPLMYWLNRPGPQPGGQAPMPMPGQPANLGPAPQWTCPAIEQLRSQVQELRSQVEELKALVKKLADKK
ncbi:MAG: Spy/CpxP family protein refolding chaperone [Thermoguttaceae bacterium]|jgi:hypothetical protein